MTAPRNWIHAGLFCVLAASASLAHAQTYPSGPVRFITPLPAGGGTDPAMRIVIDHLGKMWGQQTALVNQPGAGGALAVRTAAAAPPDAQTLLMAIASTYTSLPENQPDLVSPVNDLIPVGFVGEVPMAIAVTPALPVNSVPELVALSKKQAGGLNVALALRGGTTHLMTELLRIRSGADLTPVFYPAGAQALSDVISGRVQMTIDGLSGPVGGGQVRLLAIANERVPSHADIPTVSETVPGFTATGWGCFGCAAANTARAREQGARGLARGPRPRRRQAEVRHAQLFNASHDSAGALSFHPERTGFVEAGHPAAESDALATPPCAAVETSSKCCFTPAAAFLAPGRSSRNAGATEN